MKKLLILASFVMYAAVSFGQNPYLPLWEYIPDGEPYVFEDPDRPGEYRVYIYGSHDTRITEYCGMDLVAWSASVGNLREWRYDGVIFESKKDAKGRMLHGDGRGDVLFAPDVAEVVGKDGKKTYYLYPNNQEGGRHTMVAESYRPDGPFRVCNWDPENPAATSGILYFDPGVLVDDDGRVYGYWGFQKSYAAELDPATMATLKPGAEIIENFIPGDDSPEPFRFFEASSIRKFKGKYIFVYSRWTADGEFGMEKSNYTLAYAYSDKPLGPYIYGGTIIDGRARDTDPDGKAIATATPGGNTHGSIVDINGRWYVFYHRQCGTDEYSRQAMVAPIDVRLEGDRVVISEAEYTSEGFMTDGLDPFERHSAGLACYYTGPRPAISGWPSKTFFGSHVEPYRPEVNMSDRSAVEAAVADIEVNTNPVVNNVDGSVVGYKYFNFNRIGKAKSLQLNLTPNGVSGSIEIYIDSPWEEKGGRKIGILEISSSAPQVKTLYKAEIERLGKLSGKHALFFRFHSAEKGKSVCTLHDFKFDIR